MSYSILLVPKYILLGELSRAHAILSIPVIVALGEVFKTRLIKHYVVDLESSLDTEFVWVPFMFASII